MVMLKRHFNVIPATALFQGTSCGKPDILITFDDGEKNNLTEAFPVLQQLGLPALFFIKTDFIGKEGYMSEEDIRHVSRRGIAIGSHSHTHCDFGKISLQQAEQELTVSKNILDALVPEPTTVFAYPYGNPHNIHPSDKEALIKCGFARAFVYGGNTLPHCSDPCRIPRMMVVDVLAATLFSQIVSTLRNRKGTYTAL